MRALVSTLVLATAVLCPPVAGAKVLNVEFKFTPFVGDPKEDHVDAVPGHAVVFLNNVPVAEQDVEKATLPVLFDEREVAASVWVPAASLGPAVRHGKNTIRIEFTPSDAEAPYRAQLRWASVTDQRTDVGNRSTNQADEGVDDKSATGPVRFERTFDADFAADRPWHHAPAVTAVTDDDRRQIAALVSARTAWFKPDFAPLYQALAGREGVDVARVRKARCLDAAHKAGVTVAAPPADAIDLATTGGPEVVVRRKGGDLFAFDKQAFGRIKGDEAQMCAGMTLSLVYPPRLVVVRSGSEWQVAY